MTEINLQEALEESEKIIMSGVGQPFRFSKYSRAYFCTTENIKGYLNREGFNKNSALTVLASGDQVFNLIQKGVKKIEAFDINLLTYYVYYLKKAMIRGLSYQDFLEASQYFIYLDYPDEARSTIKKLKWYMPEDVYEYYAKIIEFIITNNQGFVDLYYLSRTTGLKIPNNYLDSEEAYLQCRKNMESTEVTLNFGDARVFPNILSNSYDIILLSNIADYLGSPIHPLTLKDFKAYINSFYQLLNKNGVIINYLYELSDNYIINNSLVTKGDLGRENIISFTGNEMIHYYNEGYYRIRKK